MKNNFQKIPLLLSVILLISSISAFAFLYRGINNNSQKAAEGMASWQAETNRRNEITSLDHSILQVAGDRASLDTHFSESSDVVPFLNAIENLAIPSGAKVEINSVEIGANNGGLVVGFKASGSFSAVYKFLDLLENFPYEIDFQSMDMHKLMVPDTASKGIKKSDWEAVFKIRLLSFIP